MALAILIRSPRLVWPTSGRAWRCETPSVISNQSRAFVNFGGSR